MEHYDAFYHATLVLTQLSTLFPGYLTEKQPILLNYLRIIWRAFLNGYIRLYNPTRSMPPSTPAHLRGAAQESSLLSTNSLCDGFDELERIKGLANCLIVYCRNRVQESAPILFDILHVLTFDFKRISAFSSAALEEHVKSFVSKTIRKFISECLVTDALKISVVIKPFFSLLAVNNNAGPDSSPKLGSFSASFKAVAMKVIMHIVFLI